MEKQKEEIKKNKQFHVTRKALSKWKITGLECQNDYERV